MLSLYVGSWNLPKAVKRLSQTRWWMEVLSESTRGYDRGTKFTAYRSMETLPDYILIDQDTVHIEYFGSPHTWRWIADFKKLSVFGRSSFCLVFGVFDLTRNRITVFNCLPFRMIYRDKKNSCSAMNDRCRGIWMSEKSKRTLGLIYLMLSEETSSRETKGRIMKDLILPPFVRRKP